MNGTGNAGQVLVNEPTKTGFTQFELSKLLITSKFFTKIKLSPSARLVLTVLCAHYPTIYPSINTIMEESGIASKTSVINSLKELSGAGFILYETKNVNHYKFTTIFFEELGIVPLRYNDWSSGGTKIGHKQITKNKNNKKENNLKKFINTSEKSADDNIQRKDHYANKTNNAFFTGINYPKFKPQKQKKESPLDLNKEQAMEFLVNLPRVLQNSYFAVELRKKWGL